MAKPEQPTDPFLERVDALRKSVGSALEKPNNGANTLVSELRALSDALGHVRRWQGKFGTSGKDSINLAVIHLDSSIKEIGTIPAHGPELEARASLVRGRLASALAQFALLGVNAVEKDEAALNALTQQFQTAFGEQKKAHEALVAEIKASVEAAKRASEAATESARKVGVTVHMTAFATASAAHRRAASRWAIAAAVIATSLLVGALYSIMKGDGPPIRDGSWYVAANLSHYLARALAVSLGSFLLVFCTRNFRSAKHNEVVNAHRAGALATHDTLKAGAGNRVDEVVSLHVADAVFTSQPSGYAENDVHGTHLTELLSAVKDRRG